MKNSKPLAAVALATFLLSLIALVLCGCSI